MNKISVLFVCMGNICRSPTAHGVFLDMVNKAELEDRIKVDSAGTHAYHVAEPPDPRAQEAALKRDVDLSGLRARKAVQNDFYEYDYVIAMDNSNFSSLLSMAPEGHEDKLKLFLEYAPHLDVTEVPDPYYGGRNGFERVLDLIEAASEGLLEDVKKHHNLNSTD